MENVSVIDLMDLAYQYGQKAEVAKAAGNMVDYERFSNLSMDNHAKVISMIRSMDLTRLDPESKANFEAIMDSVQLAINGIAERMATQFINLGDSLEELNEQNEMGRGSR